MATLLETLQKDQLQSRKDRDAIKTSLLTTLFSEAVNVGKNQGNRASTDEEVIAVIKKFVKGSKENIEIYTKTGKTEALALATQELDILQTYLPKSVSEEVLIGRIHSIMFDLNLPKESASLGKVIKALKTEFGSTLDGALASKLVKEVLA